MVANYQGVRDQSGVNKVPICILATERLVEQPLWVMHRLQDMSAVTAAFFESGH
jgi:hypothetical protein